MIITNVDDYIDRIIENHPELTEKQVKYILKFGMIAFDNYLRKGFSLKLSSPKVTMWTGETQTSDLKTRFRRRKKSIKRKARFNYFIDKHVFDGYYYFSLNDEFFKELKPLENDLFKMKKLTIYKSFEECFETCTNCHIFKFYYPTDLGFTCLLEDEIIRNYEYLGKKIDGKLVKKRKYVKRNKK